MKNKKTKLATTTFLATGIFKNRSLASFLIIVAILLPVTLYSMIAVEFFCFKRCNETPACATFYAYTEHYTDAINYMLIAAVALLVVSILCAILFVRKRSLTLTATMLTYQKGKKTIRIPLSSIENIDVGLSSLIVKIPHKKFKFKKLKNKKELYDALLPLLQAPVATSATAVSLPNTSEGKIRYFQKLQELGVITPEQFQQYSETVLTTDFPTLY